MKLTNRLKALSARGWACEHPGYTHPIVSNGISYFCVWCIGPVPGFAEVQAAYLDVAGGTVLLTGKEHKDYEWQEWLDLLDGKSAERKPLSGQRSLWED